MKKRSNKILNSFLLFIACAVIVVAMLQASFKKGTDEYVRDRVVKLHSKQGSCTGVQIKGAKKTYILTAFHCHVLLNADGIVAAEDEQEEIHYVEAIAVDPAHDLLLLSNYNKEGIDVAKHVYKHQKVRAITHGGGEPTFVSRGELLSIRETQVGMGMITTAEQEALCLKDVNTFIVDELFFKMCVKKLVLQNAFMIIWPGSSGGPVVDNSGRLIGIVSAGDQSMPGSAGIVPLEDILEFLKNW